MVRRGNILAKAWAYGVELPPGTGAGACRHRRTPKLGYDRVRVCGPSHSLRRSQVTRIVCGPSAPCVALGRVADSAGQPLKQIRKLRNSPIQYAVGVTHPAWAKQHSMVHHGYEGSQPRHAHVQVHKTGCAAPHSHAHDRLLDWR